MILTVNNCVKSKSVICFCVSHLINLTTILCIDLTAEDFPTDSVTYGLALMRLKQILVIFELIYSNEIFINSNKNWAVVSFWRKECAQYWLTS